MWSQAYTDAFVEARLFARQKHDGGAGGVRRGSFAARARPEADRARRDEIHVLNPKPTLNLSVRGHRGVVDPAGGPTRPGVMADAGVLQAAVTPRTDFKSACDRSTWRTPSTELGWTVPKARAVHTGELEGTPGKPPYPPYGLEADGQAARSPNPVTCNGSGPSPARPTSRNGARRNGRYRRIEKRPADRGQAGRSCADARRNLFLPEEAAPEAQEKRRCGDVLGARGRRFAETAARHWLLLLLIGVWQYFSDPVSGLAAAAAAADRGATGRGRADQQGLRCSGTSWRA